jgi:3-oxoacyl-[acyl-carrier-protein] synthase II
MKKKRVVITGMGVVSPLGSDLQDFWTALKSGQTGIQALTKLNPEHYRGNPIAAEVKGTETLAFAGLDQLSDYSQAVYYAAAATKLSLIDAGLAESIEEENNYGLIIGTTSGNQDMVERTINQFDIESKEDELNQDAAEMLAHFRPIELSAKVASLCNFGGTNMVIPTACAAGNYAFGTAFSMIQQGRTSVIVAGGADPFTRSCYTIFYRLGAMTQTNIQPFDENRTGMVVGEGAAMLVLEDLEHALARNATIYAEVKGYGLACDAYHPTTPDPDGSGAILAMNKALTMSKLSVSEIDYISAHGTGTKANDAHEAKAMNKVFGTLLQDLPVSGIKSMLGHCMGAASALEGVASVMSIQDQIIPPTMNTASLDPTFAQPFLVSSEAIEDRQVDNVISNAFAFGGNICSVIFGKYNN